MAFYWASKQSFLPLKRQRQFIHWSCRTADSCLGLLAVWPAMCWPQRWKALSPLLIPQLASCCQGSSKNFDICLSSPTPASTAPSDSSDRAVSSMAFHQVSWREEKDDCVVQPQLLMQPWALCKGKPIRSPFVYFLPSTENNLSEKSFAGT